MLTAVISLSPYILDLPLEVLIHHGECLGIDEKNNTVNLVVLGGILFVPGTSLDKGFPRQLYWIRFS